MNCFQKHKIAVSFIFLVFLVSSCEKAPPKYQVINTKESCLTCHSEMTGFSEYHDPKKIGCASCHLGNIKSQDKIESHKGMILIPGNLQNAAQTCATSDCHPLQLARVQKSLMTTNNGIISVDKFLFDELPKTDTLFHINNLGHSASDRHLKNLCANCHLGKEKKHYAQVDESSRGGGCLACHLNYKNGTKPNIQDQIHPDINLNIDNLKCFGCHSRSGRISTNYEGWSETLLKKEEVKDQNKYRILLDGRVFEKAPEDVHHKAGMLCIDCHTSQEIMGDGISYKHQADAVKIQCSDCHKEKKHKKSNKITLDYISIKDYALRGFKHPTNSFLVSQKSNIPLVNTRVNEDGSAVLFSKISKKELPLKSSCKKDAVHGNVSCSMCHSSWAPTCIGCHTDYDPKVVNADKTKGLWIEHVAEFGYALPTIGVKKTGNKKVFMPAIPGMVMTLDKSKFKPDRSATDIPIILEKIIFHNLKNTFSNRKGNNREMDTAEKFVRWYAPNAAHTTTTKSRDCQSCHNNPQALGFGKGDLNYVIKDKKAAWEFVPFYANAPQDHLPQDAWIGFLGELNPTTTYSSHDYFFPLDKSDQQKMLAVGACLACHQKNETFLNRMKKGDYQKMLKNKTEKCIIPSNNN